MQGTSTGGTQKTTWTGVERVTSLHCLCEAGYLPVTCSHTSLSDHCREPVLAVHRKQRGQGLSPPSVSVERVTSPDRRRHQVEKREDLLLQWVAVLPLQRRGIQCKLYV